MITVAFEEIPELETNLADISALKAGFKAINLHYQERLRAIQVHFLSAQLGDELTNDQLLQYFQNWFPYNCCGAALIGPNNQTKRQIKMEVV